MFPQTINEFVDSSRTYPADRPACPRLGQNQREHATPNDPAQYGLGAGSYIEEVSCRSKALVRPGCLFVVDSAAVGIETLTETGDTGATEKVAAYPKRCRH